MAYLKQSVRNRRKRIRKVLYQRDPRCFYCKTKLTYEKATLDHWTPLSKGGPDHIDNCVLACKPCNVAKGDHTEPQRKREMG